MALTKVRGAGAEGLTLSSTALTVANGLTLTDGNVTLASGHGIDFSATANSSGTMSSELFDDYEEGTWTPAYFGASTAGSFTFNEQQGQYTKIGNLVTCWFNLTNITDNVEGSGTVTIGGLPYQANYNISGFNGEAVGTCQMNGFDNIDGDYINLRIANEGSTMTLSKQTGSGNNTSAIPVTDRNTDGADIRGVAHYRVAN